MIGDVLEQMKMLPTIPSDERAMNSPPRFSHKILQLFQFPSLQAVLHTCQKNKTFGNEENFSKKKQKRRTNCTLDNKNLNKNEDDEDFEKPSESFVETVFSSFICDFSNAVGVQTDFNAQVSFLPELLKSYISSHQVSFLL